MKLGNLTKSRIRLQPGGERWVLVVDQTPVISTTDRRWLRRFAVRLREALARDAE